MEFTKAPVWNNHGVEPPQEQKDKGFEAGYKPPAAYFNWFWHLTGMCLEELQNAIPELALKSVELKHNMAATGWRNEEYKFSNEAIFEGSYVEFAPQSSATAEQIKAVQKANIICKSQTNGSLTLQALGEVPTMDVPVVFIVRGDL